jgi:ferritin-like metal-binding protein YciE
MDRTSEAHGHDLDPRNRPGVPMEGEPGSVQDVPWGNRPPRQPEREEHLHRAEIDELTPTFGSSVAPRLLSGVLRRAAYRIPEHEARRWLLLLAADRLDVVEHRLPELLTGRTWGQLGRQMKANPWLAATYLLGAGYLISRTRLPGALVGALSESVSRTPEEERLLAWLNDAYAMELAQIPILKNHAKDAADYPRIRDKDLEHLEQTRRHAELVRGCIERLGARPSGTKSAVGRMSGAMNSIVTEPFEDELVKNFLADYAAEHLEIASYQALIAAAQEAGDHETVRVCKAILGEEEEMARWLEKNLPMAVRETFANEWRDS